MNTAFRNVRWDSLANKGGEHVDDLVATDAKNAYTEKLLGVGIDQAVVELAAAK